jgi:hypothetical protein
MKIGAEPKKVAILVGLAGVAGIVYWMNSDSTPPPSAPRPAVETPAAPPSGAFSAKSRRLAQGHFAGGGDKPFALAENVDPSKVNPELRLDLLAKLQLVPEAPGVRNIFKREAAPPEPPPKAAAADLTKLKVDPIHPNGPQPPTPPEQASTKPPPVTPVIPAAPPIALKYYGYAKKPLSGERKAFFLDGEDVIVASEGEIIKKMYKVVRITDTAVQMEDTTSKSTQTLPIQEGAPV